MLYVLYMNKLQNIPLELSWGSQLPSENELQFFYKVVRRFHPESSKPMEEILEMIFCEMQGEVWSPKGERRSLIEKLGLCHTSMSVGDLVYCDVAKKLWHCASTGFREFTPLDDDQDVPVQDIHKAVPIHNVPDYIPLDYLIPPPADSEEGWMLGGKGWF